MSTRAREEKFGLLFGASGDYSKISLVVLFDGELKVLFCFRILGIGCTISVLSCY